MFNYIIVSIFSYMLGILSILIISIIKISSKCSINEKEDFGQIAYDEIEKRTNEDVNKY